MNNYIETNLDFDKIYDRKNTDSLKYDFAVKRNMPEDILPLWVADMDFPTSSIVLDIIKKRVEHGIFGYSETGDNYFNAVAGWMKKHHNYEVKEEWLLKTPGIVVALALAVKAYTQTGEHVLIQEPVYYPFTEVIRDNDRIPVSSDLYLDSDGKYKIDFIDFEKKIVENNIKLFLLCSPHNPVGRVWTKEELTLIGDICLKHNVIVVSDEIHNDFVFGKNIHTVFATIKPELAEITITCTSPAKTFNLAGLQSSNIFIKNKQLRDSFKKQLNGIGYSQLNTIGITACEAAYTYGSVWYDKLMEYLEENIVFTKDFLNKYLPDIKMIEPEGTYLVWLDFRKLGLSSDKQHDLIVNKAKLWLDSGDIFGKTGQGFERINIACPRKTLLEALNRLRKSWL